MALHGADTSPSIKQTNKHVQGVQLGDVRPRKAQIRGFEKASGIWGKFGEMGEKVKLLS